MIVLRARKRKNSLLLPNRIVSETFSFGTHNNGMATFALKVTLYMEETFRILCETLVPAVSLCTGQFDICLLEITDIQHNAVFFSQGGGGGIQAFI